MTALLGDKLLVIVKWELLSPLVTHRHIYTDGMCLGHTISNFIEITSIVSNRKEIYPL